MWHILTLILLLTPLTTSTSSGIDIYLCDAYSPLWGCNPSLWPNPSEEGRKHCANESNIMSWVSSPVRTDDFRLFIGLDENTNAPSSYTPDEWITVGIVKINYEMRYRGLMIYAEDDAKNKVGEWEIFDETPEVYHMPMSSCQKTVFHAGAAVKEGEQFLGFRAPAGTGRITFRALIKEGDANTGAFYWPNLEGDISLNEGASGAGTDWEITKVGQSCREYCEAQEQYCDTNRLAEIDAEKDIEDISVHFTCKLPFLSSCSVQGPSSGADDFCYYQDSQAACDAMGRDYYVPRCDVKVEDKKRFCVCADEESADEDPRPMTEVSEDTEESEESFQASGISLRVSTILLALLVCIQTPKNRTFVLFGLLVALSLCGEVEGHNWLNSPSRSVIASTRKPHLPKTNNKPHVQVGPGQKFQVEWMTGHEGRLTYFMLVNVENQMNMTQHTFALLEEWIADAKAAGIDNYAHTLHGQRLHRKPLNSNGGGLGYHEEIISGTHDNWLDRPEAFTLRSNRAGSMWSYNSTHRENDVRFDWENPKFPWIHSISRFAHTFGLGGEFDVATWSIPSGLPFGKYILQYMWAGYYDAIDIDYIDQQVEHIYGYEDPEIPTTYTRIDHCYFPGINRNTAFYRPSGSYKAVISRDPKVCLERCRVKSDQVCKHVQVIPLRVPELVRDEYKMENGHWQTIDLPQYNASYDALLEKYPEDDAYICYDLYPRIPTETVDSYIVSDDPLDPVFYSTCYIENEKRTFVGYDDSTPSPIEVPWRFGKRCLSCEDQAKIKASDYLVPHWQFADKCVNCDEEPAEIVTPPNVVYSMVRNHSICDGIRSDDISDNYIVAHHKTCTNSTERCTKRVEILGSGNSMTESACALLVANDPECSNHFSKYYASSSQTIDDYLHGCYCILDKPCCHLCSPRPVTNWFTYEVAINEFQADPTCATGTLNEDGTKCCSAECGYGQCRDGANYREAYGFCSADNIFRSCNEYGPPCVVQN